LRSAFHGLVFERIEAKMKRRELVIFSTLALGAMVASPGGFAAGAASQVEYTPQAFAKAKAEGGAVLLDFYAPW
jgi:hypothetical protein